MRDPSDIIRIWLFNKLNGAITYRSAAVPVYSFAPKDAAMPYILLAGQTMNSENEESTKDCWITKHSFTIEIYDSWAGNDMSYKGVNTISDSLLQLVRTRTAILMTGFNVISCVVDSMLTDTIPGDTENIIIKIINITLILAEE